MPSRCALCATYEVYAVLKMYRVTSKIRLPWDEEGSIKFLITVYFCYN